MKTVLLFAVLVFSTFSASGQVVFHTSASGRVKHYITTHKELLAADFILAAALNADAGSSVHCQRFPGCIETNPILGQHPSPAATFLYADGFALAGITMQHLIWHIFKDDSGRHMIWFIAGPIGISETINVKNNVDITENLQSNLQQARSRVARP